MSRKSKRQAPVEEVPPTPPPPAPEETPAVVPEEPQKPVPEVEPMPAPVAESPPPEQASSPQPDEELPPPPSDIAEQTKKYPPLQTRKPGIGASLKRTGALLSKDFGTMAKHGLVSSIIVFVVLMVVFTVSSFAMLKVVTMTIGDNGDGNGGGGGDGPNLGNDGSLTAIANLNIPLSSPIAPGTTVTLDSSGTVHGSDIMYVEWRIVGLEGQLLEDVSLYEPTQTYMFKAVGHYNVSLTVVDADFNLDQDEVSVIVGGTNTPPQIGNVEINPNGQKMFGDRVWLNVTNSTGSLDYRWKISDVFDVYLAGPNVTYVPMSAGSHQATLLATDAAGNFNRQEGQIQVDSRGSGGQWPNAKIGQLPDSVTMGDAVQLGADNAGSGGEIQYYWRVTVNGMVTHESHDQSTSFTADEFGMYEILLVVRDNSTGNAATDERGVLALAQGMEMPSMASWNSTPFGQDIPFNVLTFVYGAALLACVVFMGGLFSKGFKYEIDKGTAKTLFFAPVSVTNLVFAKLLYPLLLAPVFIFPLMLVSMIPLGQDMQQVLMITLVSYVFVALVLASAAYGSCIIYALTKRMSIRPTSLARLFMYLSLISTLTIFLSVAFAMNQFMEFDLWGLTAYQSLGTNMSMFSPFHQAGMLIKNMLLGTTEPLDMIVFVIPAVLIAGGVAASRKLFPDIYGRE